MINMFYHIMDLKDRNDLVQVLLGNMDFSLYALVDMEWFPELMSCRDSHLRVMLSKGLTACPKVILDIYIST